MQNRQLTRNGISILLQSGVDRNQPGVIAQVVAVKPLGQRPGRYRVTISDGADLLNTVLDCGLGDLVQNKSIADRCIIRVTNLTNNSISGKSICLLSGLDIIEPPRDQMIGQPQLRDVAQHSASTNNNENYQPPSRNVPPRQVPQPSNALQTPQEFAPSGEAITQIRRLNQYNKKWTIKARVMSKGPLKAWGSKNGEGRSGVLFSVDLVDATGGEIRGTAFGDTATSFEEIIQADRTYYFSNGQLKIANKQYSKMNNDYEITFGKESTLQLCEDGTNIRVPYNFIPIANITECQKNDLIDIIGIVTEMSPVMDKPLRDQNVKRRTLKVMDHTSCKIEVTLWEERSVNPGWREDENPIIAIKGAKVSEFNGRSLSVSKASRIEVNPNIEETNNIINWYNAQNGNLSIKDLSQNNNRVRAGAAMTNYKECTIAEVIAGYDESPDAANTFAIKGWITNISEKSPLTYPSCSVCKKKMVDGFCPQGHQGTLINRYIIQFSVCDETGSIWMGGFDEIGREIFGIDGDAMFNLTLSESPEKPVKMTNLTCVPYKMFIKVTKEDFQGEMKPRYRINKIQPLDFTKEANELIEKMKDL